jgi:hypothetical protein
MCMYVYVFACIIYICIYICLYLCIYVCKQIQADIYVMHLHTHISYTYTYMHIHADTGYEQHMSFEVNSYMLVFCLYI